MGSNRHELCRFLEEKFSISTCGAATRIQLNQYYGALGSDPAKVVSTHHDEKIPVQCNKITCQSLTSVRTPRMPPPFFTAAALVDKSASSAQRRAQRGAIGRAIRRTIVPPFLRRREGRPLGEEEGGGAFACSLRLFHGLSLNFFQYGGQRWANFRHSSCAFVPRR